MFNFSKSIIIYGRENNATFSGDNVFSFLFFSLITWIFKSLNALNLCCVSALIVK